jgi:hypothetical protein
MLPSRSTKRVVAPRRPLLCGDRLTDASTEASASLPARVGVVDRSHLGSIDLGRWTEAKTTPRSSLVRLFKLLSRD